MPRYSNGQIPKSELVHLGGEHWLTPATAVRWQNLRQDVFDNEGVWLNITSGPNAYRDLDAQWETYRNEPPGNAAYPSTSSHGGVYEGRDSMAIDVGNYGLVGREKFYAYARKHGFEPGYFDWEPWHIIDWAPWDVPEGETKRESEEDEVYLIHLDPNVDGRWVIANYDQGIYWQVRNGLQLDILRGGAWRGTELTGAQPPHAIEGLVEVSK